ncbi:hypothetical protein GUJ93_ZPchr0010g10990 [Zizania palustris]|uniref:Uncharacterized protein n=1 Tax=Zizania palustris TaxID=103762 RepID=A0A8J5WEH9_ZIZPA|nr:hypothetical protein GUJ93_ZPchr0010g10990 [Zizania palustris]
MGPSIYLPVGLTADQQVTDSTFSLSPYDIVPGRHANCLLMPASPHSRLQSQSDISGARIIPGSDFCGALLPELLPGPCEFC